MSERIGPWDRRLREWGNQPPVPIECRACDGRGGRPNAITGWARCSKCGGTGRCRAAGATP